jgi:phosphoglucomutase
MKDIMQNLRERGEASFAQTAEVSAFLDYQKGIDGFPSADVLKYVFANGSWIAVRPSGTEPKIKIYFCIRGEKQEDAESMYRNIGDAVKALIS